jgi:hypothetical protein
MKFQTGDLINVKECRYEYRTLPIRRHLRPHLRLPPLLHLRALPHLKNTYGVITEAINHRDAWEGGSIEDDNVYFWYSQVDAKTYWFCESELTQYEVVK